MSERGDLEILIGSHFPLLTIATFEEERTVELFRTISSRRNQPLVCWTVSDGLRSLAGRGLFSADDLRLAGEDSAPGGQRTSRDPETALRAIRNSGGAGIYLLLDFDPFLAEPLHTRLIKEIAQAHERIPRKLVFISHDIALPEALTRYSASFNLSLPSSVEIARIVAEEAAIWNVEGGKGRIRADADSVTALVRNLSGLSRSDVRRLVRSAIHDDGAITPSDVAGITAAKRELIGQEGLLSYEFDTAQMSEVGGFGTLKAWLERRRGALATAAATAPGDRPKGIMLLGVQGGGKSLAAKAVAGVFKVPLLRLDFAVLYNKFFGETERNMRQALQTAAGLAPCVLWCDEIEKGIATGDYDSGTSKRILGTLLTWMAENSRPVFIVATANNISALPPELMRKGRLDEIFFVDLPGAEVREAIFRIHFEKRELDPASFALAALAAASAGFTGAEIEQAIVAARYAAQFDNVEVTSAQVENELNATRPLSVVMAEDMQRLRAWARERCVSVE